MRAQTGPNTGGPCRALAPPQPGRCRQHTARAPRGLAVKRSPNSGRYPLPRGSGGWSPERGNSGDASRTGPTRLGLRHRNIRSFAVGSTLALNRPESVGNIRPGINEAPLVSAHEASPDTQSLPQFVSLPQAWPKSSELGRSRRRSSQHCRRSNSLEHAQLARHGSDSSPFRGGHAAGGRLARARRTLPLVATCGCHAKNTRRISENALCSTALAGILPMWLASICILLRSRAQWAEVGPQGSGRVSVRPPLRRACL